jgi:hypothetical protein
MRVPALKATFAHETGAQAAHRLFSLCAERDGANVLPIAEFLVSLYDDRHARLDTYMLCRSLSGECFEDVISVMRWFRGIENGVDIHHIVGLEPGELLVRDLMMKLRLLRKNDW